MSLLSVSLGTAGALLAFGALCNRLRRQQRQRHNQAWQASLHNALALLDVWTTLLCRPRLRS